jgi:thiamine biosynthesis protein ThiI
MRRSEERLTCVVCKRRMYRLAAALATEVGALGIVTGESLGQVASQTLDNLGVLDGAVDVPVYRPLIGLDKEEIIGIARRIGTFTPSIAPGRGCRAVPDVAATKAALAEVAAIEAKVDCQR